MLLQKGLILPLLFFIICGFLVYGNGLRNEFVADDTQQIVNNPVISNLTNIPSFFRGSTFYSGSDTLSGVYYKPVTVTFFALLSIYLGKTAFVFHLAQLLLHITNAYLLFLVLKYFFRTKLALVLSTIFLVHPANSESVLYISATQEVLFFFLGITAVCFMTTQSKKQYLFVSAFLLLVSLLSKETGILFLVISGIFVFLFKRKNKLLTMVSLAAVFLTYVVLRISAVGVNVTSNQLPLTQLNLATRLLMVPWLLYTYLLKLFFPLALSSSYQFFYQEVDFTHFFVPLLVDLVVVLLIFVVGFLLNKKARPYFKTYLFFVMWFGLGIGMLLQIIPLDAALAERWLYFPMVGMLGMIGVVLTAFQIRLFSLPIKAIVIGVLLLLSMRSVARTFDWKDYFTLAQHDIGVTPNSPDLEDVIGVTYLQQGQLDKAKLHLDKSLALSPNFQNYNNLGLYYFAQKDYAAAEAAFLQSLAIHETYQATENIVVVSFFTKPPEETKILASTALSKYPQNPKLWLVLGLTNYKLNLHDEALAATKKAYSYNSSPEIGQYYEKMVKKEPLQIDFGNRPE